MKPNIYKLLLILMFCSGLTLRFTPNFYISFASELHAEEEDDDYDCWDWSDWEDFGYDSPADYILDTHGSYGWDGDNPYTGEIESSHGDDDHTNASVEYDWICNGCDGKWEWGPVDKPGNEDHNGNGIKDSVEDLDGNGIPDWYPNNDDGYSWGGDEEDNNNDDGDSNDNNDDWGNNNDDDPEHECDGTTLCPTCGKYTDGNQYCEKCPGHDECEGEQCTVCGGYKTNGDAPQLRSGTECKACTCRNNCITTNGEQGYLNYCNQCISSEHGLFNNTLTGEALEAYNAAMEALEDNCFTKYLLSALNNDSGITISLGNSSGIGSGSFEPCSSTITFTSVSTINSTVLAAEIFHAYQEQLYNGNVSSILNNSVTNHMGGSNLEFEEKATVMIHGLMSAGSPSADGTEMLQNWILEFLENHPFGNPVMNLSEQEKASWFEALEYFQEKHKNDTNMYGKPIDYNILPDAFLNLYNNANC